jgi:hypothetical protein
MCDLTGMTMPDSDEGMVDVTWGFDHESGSESTDEEPDMVDLFLRTVDSPFLSRLKDQA